MEKNIDYIKTHKAISISVSLDIELRPVHKSMIETMFFFWNKSQWKDKFLVTRDDVMEFSKISNRKTMYKVFNELQDLGYLEYFPSKNPEIASAFSMGKKVPREYTSTTTSDTTPAIPSEGTILKHLNKETFKEKAVSVNNKYKVINSVGLKSFIAFYSDKLNLVSTEESIALRLNRWLKTDRNGTDIYREKTEPLERFNDGYDMNSGTVLYRYKDTEGNVFSKSQVFEEDNQWFKKVT